MSSLYSKEYLQTVSETKLKDYISDIIKYYKNNLNKTNEDITQK